jgi:hypothetical protein
MSGVAVFHMTANYTDTSTALIIKHLSFLLSQIYHFSYSHLNFLHTQVSIYAFSVINITFK